MDDLLKIAGNVMENFNPETDSASDFDNLPDGTYEVLITDVSHRTSEKGTKSVALKTEITSEAHNGRFLFVNYYFTEKTTERSIKTVLKLVNTLGFENLTVDAFKSIETLSDSLQALVGTEAIIKQTTSKSGFANQEVSAKE